jgi:hypothetical protein
VNNGFPEIVLRKSKELLKRNYDNPDYLALQAFIFCRINKKEQVLEYSTEAERITVKSSRLKQMIEEMKQS